MLPILTTTLAVFLSTAAPTAPALIAEDQAFEQRLAVLVERMEQERVELHIPGFALAVVKDDELVLAQGFGLADVEKERPVTAETLFAIGSSTKAFTALVIGMLQDEGTMSFDDPIVKHLPYFELKLEGPDSQGDSTVTVRDLLSHRTGFTRMTALWGPGTASRDLILHTAVKAEPWDGFREKFYYNNVMFLAAGEASAATTGKSWEELVQTRLLDPLGMTSSNLSTVVAQKDERLSLGYMWNEDTESWDHKRMLDLQGIAPAGAINSNVLDMAKWLRLQLGRGEFEGRRLVSEATLEDTWTPNIEVSGGTSYGLGWMLQDRPDGRVIEHGGNIDGFSAQVALMPEQGLGFVLLTNVSVTPLQAKSISLVFDTLLQDPDEASEESFEKYLGNYVANFGPFDNVNFEVLVRNGNLAVDVPGQTVYELHLPEEDGKRFFRLTREIAISFELDASGNPVAMRMYQSGLAFELPREGVEIPAEVPLEELDRFLGSYRDDKLSMTAEVKIANNRLAVDIPSQMVFELHLPDEEGKRYFRITDEIAIRFNEDASGLVTSMTFFEKGEEREAVRILDESTEAAPPLPSLDEFLEQHGASDRAKLLLEHGSFRSKGKIRMAQSGIEGTYVHEVRQSPPAFRLSLDLGPFGSSQFGSDGEVAWRENSLRGYSEASGDALRQRLRDHPVYLYGDWRTSFDSVKLERQETEEDRELYVLEARWGDLPKRTITVDRSTGQRLRMQYNFIEGSISVPITITYEDLLEVSGVPIWRRMIEENIHSGRTIQTLESIELGVELADDFHAFQGSKD